MGQFESGVYEVAGPTLSEIIRSVISVEDPGEVLAAAVSKCGELVRADGALVLVWSLIGAELSTGAPRADVRVVGPLESTGIAGSVALTRVAVLVPDVSLDPGYEPAVDAPAHVIPHSLIAVPLIAHGDLLGVLQVVRGKGRRSFSVAERDLLGVVAPHVAIAMYNALTVKRLREAQIAAAATQADLELQVQKRTELLMKGKREWESTVDAISEPLALLKEMTVTRANLAYGKKAGVDIRSVPGKKCFELLAHRNTPCEGCPVLELQGREPRQAELRMGPLHLQVSTFPTGDDGSVVVHYRDVTEQRELEVRLRQSERLASLGQLASGAAHEINNPLGFVISNLRSMGRALEELAGSPLTTELREAAADALQGAERVSGIVRAMRAMATQHMGAVEVLRLSDAAGRALSKLLGSGAKVTTDFSADARARAVPLLLDQALSNLLTNAGQAVKDGGQIAVTTGVDAAEAWVRVADDGPGIAPADLPRIFEPFFTTRGVGGGVGLGLTAVWSIVTGFGGTVDVESALGRGAAFTIRLPRVVSGASGGRPDHRAAAVAGRNLTS